MGVQLDSLADVVSFGVLPGSMLFVLLQSQDMYSGTLMQYLPFSAFVFPVFGAYRLAKFNLDDRVADHFYGLPIPSAAIYLAGLYWVQQGNSCCAGIFTNPIVLLVSLLLLCYLMVSDMPHFNLKFKSLAWRGQKIKWIYLMCVVLLLIVLREAGIPLSIVLYILLSLGHNVVVNSRLE